MTVLGTNRDRAFADKLVRELGQIARTYALPAVSQASRTLGRYLDVIHEGGGVAHLYVPQYWAVYLHDGRRRISANPPRRVLVWFRNPNNDPRLRGGNYPIRQSNRRMTEAQFQFWLEENRRAIRRGTMPPMVIARSSGPTEGKEFFSNAAGGGMDGFSLLAFSRAEARTKQHIRRELEDVLDLKATSVFRI